MTPHDSAAMPRAISGLSATLGCPEELPREFKMDSDEAKGIIGEMVYRLIGRTGTGQTALEYDTENPFDVLNKATFHALIDGAGAFRAHPAETVADKVRMAQAHLKQVGYNDGKPHVVGKQECSLSEKGYYFTKAKSRGADTALDPEATALLTVDGFKTLEDLTQNDGRMRLKGQKIRIARSKRNPEITNTEALLVKSCRNEGQNHAVGLFRSKMQEIPHLVRQEAYTQLLAIENFDATLNQFAKWEKLFIQTSPHDYNQIGSYFKQNHAISKHDHAPKVVLETKKASWLAMAKSLGLTVDALQTLAWDDELLAKMPAQVAGPEDFTATGLEVEQEMEEEHEVEAEMDVEVEQELEEELRLDQCGDIPYYPAWIGNKPKEYSAHEKLHAAFDPRIVFTENFLPLQRKDQLFKRTAFDHAMPQVKNLHIVMNYRNGIEKIIIGDVLDDVIHRPYGYHSKQELKPRTESYNSYTYDLHTRRPIAGDTPKEPLADLDSIVAQVRFLNGEYEGYTPDEWTALIQWLKSSGKQKEMCDFFEKTILRTKPRRAAAFRLSNLYRSLQADA